VPVKTSATKFIGKAQLWTDAFSAGRRYTQYVRQTLVFWEQERQHEGAVSRLTGANTRRRSDCVGRTDEQQVLDRWVGTVEPPLSDFFVSLRVWRMAFTSRC
jgi:hypothetical protein